MLYTLQDKHNAESNSVIQLFFVRTAPAGAAPSHPVPSLPLPASSLHPSARVCWEAPCSSFQEGLKRTSFPSCTQAQKEQNGFGKVTAFCTFTTTEIKRCLPAGGRPLCSPHTPCPPRPAAELWAGSAEPPAEWDSAKQSSQRI